MHVLVWKLKVRYKPDTVPDPYPIRIQGLMTINWRKKIQLKYLFFLIKNCNLLTSKLQEKPSALTGEHRALQKMKLIYFFHMFVGHFCPPGSGSGSDQCCESGYEARDPIESGFNPDPDQQHCPKSSNFLINDTFVMSWGILSRAWAERLESTASSSAGLRASPTAPTSGSRSTSAASSADSREDSSARTWKTKTIGESSLDKIKIWIQICSGLRKFWNSGILLEHML